MNEDINIEQIRENISILISEIISMRKERDKDCCVKPEAMYNKTCNCDCDKCKIEYYKNMEKYLNDEFNI